MNKLILGALLIVVLSGSALPARAGDNSFWGTGVGAALGGLAGAQIGKGTGQLAATGAGVFLGGMMGNSVGQSLDRGNAAYYRGGGYSSYTPYYYQPYQPTYVAPPSAPPPQVIYVQPEEVEYYAPRRRSVYVEEGYLGPPPPKPQRHCREFTQTIRIDGQVRESYGTACLRPDGTWQIEQ